MLRNVGRAVIVKGGKDSSLDCALFNTYRRSKEPSETQSGFLRYNKNSTIQLNNVSILEAGTTWQAPPGVPAGTKCIFMKQRPLLDLVTGTFSFIQHLDGGW